VSLFAERGLLAMPAMWSNPRRDDKSASCKGLAVYTVLDRRASMGPWVRREKQRGRRVRLQGSANFQKSLAYYNKAIQLKPKLAEAYMYRGVLYAQMGRKADAQADLVLLKKMNGHLAKELEQFMQTGKEDDELYGATKKK
jgi:tetratricopeptide (TPR) repeat protein